MLLLVVYEDDSKPLIKYWINEGAELMMAKNKEWPTGLGFDQCIAKASFVGDVDISKVSKAELLTVIPSLRVEDLRDGVTVGDALMFNGWNVGTPRGKSYWKYEGEDCMALTANHWEDVTNYLESTNNKAEIQSKGNFMLVTNAVLKVTYLPDLTVSLSAPSSVKAGTTQTIKVSVRNLGESKAEDFVVRLNASKGTVTPSEQKIELLNGTYEGNNTVTVNFKWTAPKLAMPSSGYIQRVEENVNISVEVDPYNNVEELNENNNADDITVTVWDVLTRNPELRPPGGRGAGGGTGTGFGTGNKSGREAVAFGGAPAESEEAGKGKEVKEESHAKTLWGYLLRKILVPGEEKAGGSSGFLLWEYLIKVSAFLIGIAFLVLGYLFERRRHNAAKHVRKERKSRGESER